MWGAKIAKEEKSTWNLVANESLANPVGSAVELGWLLGVVPKWESISPPYVKFMPSGVLLNQIFGRMKTGKKKLVIFMADLTLP